MPTNRKRIDRTPVQRLTPQVIAAWQAGDMGEVNRLLGTKPWQVPIHYATADRPPDWSDGSPWAESWPRARELHVALIEQAGKPGRVGRHGEGSR